MNLGLTPKAKKQDTLLDGTPLSTIGSPAAKLKELETLTENSIPDDEDPVFDGARPNSAFKTGKRRMSTRQRLLTKSKRRKQPRRASTTAIMNTQLPPQHGIKKAWGQRKEEDDRPTTAPVVARKKTRKMAARLSTSARKQKEDDNVSTTSSDDLSDILPEPMSSPLTKTLNKSLRRSSKRLMSAGKSRKQKNAASVSSIIENSNHIIHDFDHTFEAVRGMMVEIKEQENANPAQQS
eukprot:CAMPEP_0117429000 /NCGR_PEP_ID=MMETSP0758-20121206/8585_1 /TAXON_ID=63605 /ORGANISM="Percolomonas cosmopolitus, Strain AE-1 (ATCC 50343)" /LENGTH=236 /DNA_ID=CAMNT_0005215673 /DNA_START=8 /DNA_END=715 /DNA_ORIENTATION=+